MTDTETLRLSRQIKNLTEKTEASPLYNYSLSDILLAAYPIGSIYTSVNSTSPATLFGGTWEAFAAGKVLVGINSSDTDFDTVEETGGEKVHTLNNDELPTHTHTLNNASGIRTNNVYNYNTAAGTAGYAGQTTITANNTGGGLSHNNLQPYIVVYMWKRTA